MLDWYLDLPATFRNILALVVLTAGIGLTIVGYRGRPTRTETPMPDGRVLVTETENTGARSAFRIGMVTTGVGAVLLMTCGKSSSEGSGYHF